MLETFRLQSLALLFLVFLVVQQPAIADQIVLDAVADAAVFQGDSTSNFGSDINLIVGEYSGEWWSFIRWDIAGAAGTNGPLANATIDSVTLRLQRNCTLQTSGPVTTLMGTVASGWSEDSITWDIKPIVQNCSLAIYPVAGCTSGVPWLEFTDSNNCLRDMVQSVVDGNSTDNGIALVPSGASTFHRYWSRNAEDGSVLAAPQLVIDYAAAPSTGNVDVIVTNTPASDINATILYKDGLEVARVANPGDALSQFRDIPYGDNYYAEAYCWDMFVGRTDTFSVNSASIEETISANERRPLTVTVYFADGVTIIPGTTVELYSWENQSASPNLRASEQDDDLDGSVQFSAWPTTRDLERYQLKVIRSGDLVYADDNVTLADSPMGSDYVAITDIPLNAPVIHSVPYYDQYGSGWCVYHSFSMICGYYGVHIPPWRVAANYSTPFDEGVNYPDIAGLSDGQSLQGLMNDNSTDHYTCDLYFGLANFVDWPYVRMYLEQYGRGAPVMLGVGPVPSTACGGDGEAGHAVVIVGVGDAGVYVHDPSGSFLCWAHEVSPTFEIPPTRIAAFVPWDVLHDVWVDSGSLGYASLWRVTSGPVTAVTPTVSIQPQDYTGYLLLHYPLSQDPPADARFCFDGEMFADGYGVCFRELGGSSFPVQSSRVNFMNVRIHNSEADSVNVMAELSISGDAVNEVLSSSQPLMLQAGQSRIVSLLSLERPFRELPPGQYTLHFAVLAGSSELDAFDLQFELFPSGVISVDPTSLGFGAVPTGISYQLQFAVTNIGADQLEGEATVPPPFEIVSGGSYSLAPGETQQVTVGFTPDGIGVYEEAVSLTGGGNASVTVTGEGVAGTEISVTPSELNFDNVRVSEFAHKALSVTNNGVGVLSGQASVAPPFAVTPETASYTLNAGESHVVNVTFSPPAALAYQGELTFTGGGGATVSLQGQGVTLTVVTDPDNAELCVGGTANFTVIGEGLMPTSYQWRRGGVPLSDGGNITGATTDTLTISPATEADAGDYDIEIVSHGDAVDSDSATLVVNATPEPPMGASASATSICAGSDITLTADAGSNAIDWYADAVDAANFLGTGTNLVVSPDVTATYLAVARDPATGCESEAAAEVTVTVTAAGTGDMDASGTVDAADVPLFVSLLLSGGTEAEQCAADMNGDGQVDGRDIQGFVNAISVGTFSDCNDNGVDDTEDINNGTSLDENSNGTPDECEVHLDEGLLAYYPFDGDATDASGNGFDGSEQGGVTYVPGVFGQAASFDGVDDWIRVDHGGALSFDIDEESYSISVWVRVFGQEDNCIAQDRYGSNTSVSYTLTAFPERTTPVAEPYYAGSYYGTPLPHYGVLGGGDVDTSQWQHLAIVHDHTSGLSLYLNGALVDQVPVPSDTFPTPESGNGTTTIGGYWSSHNRVEVFLDGMLDEMRFYGRPLTPLEIEQLATRPVPPINDCNNNGVDDSEDINAGTSLDENLNGTPDECETDLANGLLAYYPFDGDATDSSGSGLDGSEQNGVTYAQGLFGQAASFDGVDDWIRVDHGGALSFDIDQESFSISVWAKVFGQDDNCIAQDRHGSNTSVSYTITAFPQRTTPVAQPYYSGAWYEASAPQYQVFGGDDIDLTQWQHLAVVHNHTSGMRLYVNGVLVDEATVPPNDFPSPGMYNSTTTIGGYWSAHNGMQVFLDGMLDEMRFYGRALTTAEVQSLAQRP